MDRVWRRYRQIRKKLTALGINIDDLSSHNSSIDTPPTDPFMVEFYAEAETIDMSLDIYETLTDGYLRAMREGSPENQDKLLANFTEAMRSYRWWHEKHVALLERALDHLK